VAATAEGRTLNQDERDRMHKGKRRFAKQGEAIDYVVRLQRQRYRYQGRVYWCAVCNGYHVAHGVPPMQAA
jgi:hypothetical protein